MSQLTVASKAGQEIILPVVAVASCVQQISKDSGLSITYEDVESVGDKGGKLELKLNDGTLIYDDDIVPYLRDQYEFLQSGDKEQVCRVFYI